jgi:hypothetical protein
VTISRRPFQRPTRRTNPSSEIDTTTAATSAAEQHHHQRCPQERPHQHHAVLAGDQVDAFG